MLLLVLQKRVVAAEHLKNEISGPFFMNEVQGYNTKLTSGRQVSCKYDDLRALYPGGDYSQG
jgi:hypothetical protein